MSDDFMSVIAPKPAVDATAPSASWSERLNGYGALSVTGTVFLLLGLAMCVTAYTRDTQTFGNLVETVKSLAMVAGGFWLRSLSGPKKDDTIATLGSALAVSAPPTPVVTTTTTAAAEAGGSTITRTSTGSAAAADNTPPTDPPPAAGAEQRSPDAEIEALRPQQPQP